VLNCGPQIPLQQQEQQHPALPLLLQDRLAV
jgi:hypothetical protein